WELDHFVVLERAGDDAIDIVDPSVGRRRVPLAQAARSFTGVALTFEPTDRFAPADARGAPVWRILRAVLAESGDWKRIVVVSALLQLFALALPLLTGAVVDTVVPR